MNPTTPHRQALRADVATDLQSTPQSLGSAARSKDLSITGVQVAQVHPWIARDIDNAEECEVDLMLQSFLLDCMVDEHRTMKDAADLFELCLCRVFPICNGEEPKFNRSGDIKKQLEAYSSAQKEDNLYPAFTRAANTALVCLEHLEVDGLRNAPNECSERLFFRVGGREIVQIHQGERSVRKPDMLLVSAVDVSPEPVGDDRYLDIASTHPETKFSWRIVRTVVEFKFKRSIKRPPAKYTYAPAKYTYEPASKPSKPLLDSVDSEEQTASWARGYPQTSESQSGILHIKEPGSVPSGSSATTNNSRKRKLTASAIDSQSQQASEWRSQGSQPQLKQLKVEFDNTPPAVQVGMYGAEMFASHAGRQHVICLLIIGDRLRIWRYDRQGAIRCCDFNFIQDLPRFLVLLLAMQRFRNRDWGLNPRIDPDFCELSEPSTTVYIDGPEKDDDVDITLDLSLGKRVSHYGLNGRATNVCPATSKKFGSAKNLVAKLYWGETSRTSEADILKRVYEIAEIEPDVRNHVPEMMYAYMFRESSTATIRERLRLPIGGTRVLSIILLEELMRITGLIGDGFLTSWWDTVKCHLALWKHGVHHRDVSASNLMCRPEKSGAVGVLNDFDLATLEEGERGNERTGTVPFMALDLLTEDALAGKVKHTYAHDAESFIWVLVWICLRYENGVLRQENRPLDEWTMVDAIGCREKKRDFLTMFQKAVPGDGHRNNWMLACKCLAQFEEYDFFLRRSQRQGLETVSHQGDLWWGPFKNFLQQPVFSFKEETNPSQSLELPLCLPALVAAA